MRYQQVHILIKNRKSIQLKFSGIKDFNLQIDRHMHMYTYMYLFSFPKILTALGLSPVKTLHGAPDQYCVLSGGHKGIYCTISVDQAELVWKIEFSVTWWNLEIFSDSKFFFHMICRWYSMAWIWGRALILIHSCFFTVILNPAFFLVPFLPAFFI